MIRVAERGACEVLESLVVVDSHIITPSFIKGGGESASHIARVQQITELMDIFLDVGKSSHEVAHVVLHVLCCVRVGFGSLLAINIPEYSYSVLDSRRVCSEGLYLFQQIDQFDLGLLKFLRRPGVVP